MSKKKELAFNTIIIGIGKFGTQVISFLLLPLYTTILSTTEYGIYDLILTISIFMTPIVTLLMEESMFRFLIDAKDNNEKGNIISQVIRYITKRLIIFSIIVIIIGFFVKRSEIYVALLFIISGVALTSINAIIRGLGKIKLFSIINFINAVGTIILNVIFILKLKLGYLSLLYSATIINMLCVIAITCKLKLYKYIRYKKQNNKIKEMKKYSLPLVPNSISWSIINTSDRLIISVFLGTGANGVYSMANKFPTIMDTIYGFFYTAWKESAAKALKDDDSSNFYNNIYDVLKRLLFTIVIGIFACMPFVFSLLIKNEFKEAYIYIPILILAMYYSNMSGFYGGIFSAYKDTKIMGYTTMISAIVNLIVNIIFIHFIGIWAAALSTLIATFTVYLIRKKSIKKIIILTKDSLIMKLVKVFSVIFTVFVYYSNSMILNIISLAYVLVIFLLINRKSIGMIMNFAKDKFLND